MKTLLLNLKDVESLLSMEQVIESVREGYMAFDRGEVQQPDIVSMETPDSTAHDSSPLISAAVNTRIYLPLFRSILCFNGIIFPCGFQLWKR